MFKGGTCEASFVGGSPNAEAFCKSFEIGFSGGQKAAGVTPHATYVSNQRDTGGVSV